MEQSINMNIISVGVEMCIRDSQEVDEFNGVGRSKLTMSLGYKDGNYSAESQVPVYTSSDAVSYTHLDVYKRQDILFPAFILHRSSVCRCMISKNSAKLEKEPLHQSRCV